MSNPWNINKPTSETNFADILSEEYAQQLHKKEIKKLEKRVQKRQKQEEIELNKQKCTTDILNNMDDLPSGSTNSNKIKDSNEWEDYSSLLSETNKIVTNEIPSSSSSLSSSPIGCDSDAVIAELLQSQFDHEYNQELSRLEKHRNKDCKVKVTLDKYRINGDLEFIDEDSDNEVDDDTYQKRDWDRFETNEKLYENIPKCGFKLDNGEMITKHNSQLCGVRNACRVMNFPPCIPTGDGAGFDMELSNKVYNQLKGYSRRTDSKKNKMEDRKVTVATAEMGIDEQTRIILLKFINNQLLEQINGIISTGKEAIILHAASDSTYTGEKVQNNPNYMKPPRFLPKECAVKVFKTTLNEFKQRGLYIKDDYRFKNRFNTHDNRVIINMWAEKEMHNLVRMRSIGINCPRVVILKKHVLVMEYIGDTHQPASKLKDAQLNDAELSCAYEEIVAAMHKLYNEADLVHADLNEYNILWYNNKCYIIDVAQSVEPKHPSALEFLMRDCCNIINFFKKRGLSNIYTKEELFEYITTLDAETHNVSMLERIHTTGASIHQSTCSNDFECPDEFKPIQYPFESAWEQSQKERNKLSTISAIDNAKNTNDCQITKCSLEAVVIDPLQETTKSSQLLTVDDTANK